MAEGHADNRNPGDVTGGSPYPPVLVTQYADREPLLQKALAEIRTIVGKQIGKIGDRHLVRASLAEGRVKTLAGLWDKARRNDW